MNGVVACSAPSVGRRVKESPQPHLSWFVTTAQNPVLWEVPSRCPQSTSHQVTSWVMANIELGQEIFWPWCFCFMEEPHNVCPLLPHFNGFLELHLSLNDQEVNHSGVGDMGILHEHFSDFIPSLFHRDIQLH